MGSKRLFLKGKNYKKKVVISELMTYY